MSCAAQLTISCPAIAANYRLLAQQVNGKQVAAAVKANAYGLGVAQIAPVLKAAGCTFYYVASLEEATQLRGIVGTEPDIAVLHGIAARDHAIATEHRLIPVLNDLGAIQEWHIHAQQHKLFQPVIIHLDTGMNRLGLSKDDIDELLTHPDWFNGLKILLWLSHLACADDQNNPMNAQQQHLFTKFLIKLPLAPLSFANSSGIFLGSNYHFDQVRPGCALYGINPTPGRINPMQPVVRLEAPILQLRDLTPWVTVGYGASWRSKRLGKAATLPVGYADGFMRSLSNRGLTYCSGHPAPVIGRVSMDLIVIDVTDVPDEHRQPGTMVELIGAHQDVDALAMQADTISYEILTQLGSRYQRVYEGRET
ncbi:MAG: alanine racemase [Alphaproteobacteria bacterium]